LSTTICVFGSSKPVPHQREYEQAYELGKLSAIQGWNICNGGYGGIMQASAEGAKSANGKTIGVTCSIFSRSGANEFIDEEIKTNSLMERLNRLIELGDAYVILPGGSGTLVEFALVWELIAKKLMPQKPIVLLTDFWMPVAKITATERPNTLELLEFVLNPKEAIDVIRNKLRANKGQIQ